MSYKALFVLVAIYNLEIEQMGGITAFLHGKLTEIIYILATMPEQTGSVSP